MSLFLRNNLHYSWFKCGQTYSHLLINHSQSLIFFDLISNDENASAQRYDDPKGNKALIAFVLNAWCWLLREIQNVDNSWVAKEALWTKSFLISIMSSSSSVVNESSAQPTKRLITHSRKLCSCELFWSKKKKRFLLLRISHVQELSLLTAISLQCDITVLCSSRF